MEEVSFDEALRAARWSQGTGCALPAIYLPPLLNEIQALHETLSVLLDNDTMDAIAEAHREDQ